MLKIYKASAGSGKTYTLAYEYIRTLLGVKRQQGDQYRLNHIGSAPGGIRLTNRHRHILAITFTNKATEEMKKRIVKELDLLAGTPERGEKDSDFAPRLCKEFGCDRQQLAESAAKALEELLDTYSDFNVTTIDSFFQRVLRTFARELDRQGDFAIEIDDKMALQLTVNKMLDDFNRNPEAAPDLKNWLIDFMMRSVEEGSKANFLNRSSYLYLRLIKLATEICYEKFKPYSDEMREYLGVGVQDATSASKLSAVVEHLYRLCHNITSELRVRINKMWDDFAADGVTPDMLSQKGISTRLLTKIIPDGQIPEYGDLSQKTLTETLKGEATPFVTKRFKGNDIHVERVREELHHAVESYIVYFDYQVLLKALPQLSLLAYAWTYLDNIIADNNMVLLSDTNHLLQRIIGADETPFIYERMGVNLTNFLIDEFQDTSKMQWKNLKPLLAQSLASDHDNLIIGDEKQSIYRFRNSDSSLLHTQVADVDFPEKKGFDTYVEGDKPGQNTNWRSAADIVKFNNTLFTVLASVYGVDCYDNVIQQIAGKKTNLPGYVRFISATLPDTESAPAHTDKTKKDKTKKDKAKKDKANEEAVIDRMAEDIRRQHKDGKYEWKDIAVLVNRNVEGAKVIERLATIHPDIPVISSDSMLLRKSTAVMMVIAILRIYAQAHTTQKVVSKNGNIYPDTAQTAAIISHYKYLRRLDGGSYENPYDAIAKATEIAAAGKNLAEKVVSQLISRRPSSLVSLIETIIHDFVGEDERKEQSAYLAAFEDFALEWSERYSMSLPAFLAAWEQQKNKLSVTSASDINAVTVLTIHKSKGLQYDCVHIPFGSWREAKGEYNLWLPFPQIQGLKAEDCPPAVFVKLTSCVDNPGSIFNADYEDNLKEEYADNLNKTYVAYTRAARELTVYYDPDEEIGKTLKAVFDGEYDSKGNPCLLRWPDDVDYDSASGNLIIGGPTCKETDGTPERQRIYAGAASLEKYEVSFSESAEVYTRVDDMLDDSPAEDNNGDDIHRYSADDFIDEESRLRGIALHDIISRVITADDAEGAVRYHAMHKDIPEEEENSLLSDIKAMLAAGHPKVSQWFAPDADVLTEQTIYLPDVNESVRVDRLVRYPDGSADIIDYKFTTRHRSTHTRQVNDYIKSLKEMGFTDVRGYLWYPLISPDKIIEVKNQGHYE